MEIVGITMASPLQKTIKGSLDRQNLASVLLTVFLHRFSGLLDVNQDKVQKKIFFEEGNIVFAASNLNRDRLGDILLEEKKITREHFDASVIELKKGKKRQGAIFVQLGALTTQELILAIRHQIRVILFSILPWNKGTFTFTFLDQTPKETVTLRENTLNLLSAATESVTNREWLQKGIKEIRSQVNFPGGVQVRGNSLSMTPQERKIYLFVTEKDRTLEQVCQWSEYNEAETIKSLHYLLSQELLQIRNPFWNERSAASGV
jgi:hypothetical protein